MSEPLEGGGKKEFSFGRKLLFTAVIFGCFLVLLTVIGEFGVRIFSPGDYSHLSSFPFSQTSEKDDYLGWKMKPGYTFEGSGKDQRGNSYDLVLAYDENGFKAFGNELTNRPKVFFIGDSYTASVEVSNEKTFFNLLKDSLGIEVFAYGQAGYGTLQEYLILDLWIDRIKPDLVVWEVCCNDFIDNYAPLEMRCGYRVGERRPYLDTGGRIYYEKPVSNWAWIKRKIHFYQWLENHWHPFKKKVFGLERRFGEDCIAEEKRAFKPFERSVEVTEKIADLIKARIPPGTRSIFFLADLYDPQEDEMARIFEEKGFLFTRDPARAVQNAEKENLATVRACDGYHWNEKGHELIANALLPLLKPLVKCDEAR